MVAMSAAFWRTVSIRVLTFSTVTSALPARSVAWARKDSRASPICWLIRVVVAVV